MPANMKIKIHAQAEIDRIQKAGDQALTLVRDELIADANNYVPIGGGKGQDGGGGSLRDSAFHHSDQEPQDGEMTLRWDTPYAQYQHGGLVMHGTPKDRSYGPEKLKYTDAAARSEWTKHVMQEHGDDWALMIERAISRYL